MSILAIENVIDDFVGRGIAGLRSITLAAWWRDGVVHVGDNHLQIAVDRLHDFEDVAWEFEHEDENNLIDLLLRKGWMRLDYLPGKGRLTLESFEGIVSEQKVIDIVFNFEQETGQVVKTVEQYAQGSTRPQIITIRESLIDLDTGDL